MPLIPNRNARLVQKEKHLRTLLTWINHFSINAPLQLLTNQSQPRQSSRTSSTRDHKLITFQVSTLIHLVITNCCQANIVRNTLLRERETRINQSRFRLARSGSDPREESNHSNRAYTRYSHSPPSHFSSRESTTTHVLPFWKEGGEN